MKKIIIGALTLSAQLLSYSVIANDHLSIEDLKRLCHQYHKMSVYHIY